MKKIERIDALIKSECKRRAFPSSPHLLTDEPRSTGVPPVTPCRPAGEPRSTGVPPVTRFDLLNAAVPDASLRSA